jgi:hypothetical protein
MAQANHHTTSKADFIKSIAADPAGAINSGKLKMQKQEVPLGGIGKAVAKVGEKIVEKGLAKAAAKASKIVGKDVSKPGTLEKLSEGMTQSEKRNLASKLKQANVKDKPGLNSKPTQAKPDSVKGPTKSQPTGPSEKELKRLDFEELQRKHDKALNAAQKAGLTGKVTTTHNGKSVTSTI